MGRYPQGLLLQLHPLLPQGTRPPSQNGWELKLKISRLRLEMTGASPALQAPPQPSRPTPFPSPHWGEGHLAVGVLADGAFAASPVPMIAYLPGRCIAVR